MTFDATDSIGASVDLSVGGTVFSGVADWDNTTATQGDYEPTAAGYGPVVWHKVWVGASGTCTFADVYPPAGDTVMEVYRGPATVGSFSPSSTGGLVSVGTGDDEAGNGKPQVVYESTGGEWLYIAHSPWGGGHIAGQVMSWSIPVGSAPTPLAEPRPTVSLYDTDGTHLADLPLAAGIQWQDETSAPGAVSLRLPLDDATTALATSRRIVKVFWRGKFRQAARIDSSSTDVAVDGRKWREWQNLPGLLSLLGRVPIYPEYGLGRASNSQRTLGYMSRNGDSVWLTESGNFTPAIGVAWSDMTGYRAGLPEGLDFPNPQWIAKRGPLNSEPAGSYQYFRRLFTSTATMNVMILVTGDNFVDLWLDGEQIVSADGQDMVRDTFQWRNLAQVTAAIPPSPPGGAHTLAARIRNKVGSSSRMGFLFTMQEIDDSGNPKDQPPIINSNSSWSVSDLAPGFRRAEVVNRFWSEATTYGYAATSLLHLGFTTTTDSSGVAWSDGAAEYTFDVGTSLLDALGTFTEKDLDAAIDPDTLHLKMWNRRGSDLTDTVRLTLGDGGGILSHRVDRVEPVFNTVLMQLADGRWMQRQTPTAVAADGREGTGLSAGSTSDTASAYQLADAQLADAALTQVTFTTQVSTLAGPQVYVDYDLGDTITVPDENGTGVYAARLMSVTVDVPDDGSPVQVTPELMLDRSATPMVIDAGGPGIDDPGDIEAPAGGGVPIGGDSGGGSTSGNGMTTWADTFTTLDTTRWNVRTDTQSNHYGYNLPANVTIQSDGLHITAKRESYGGKAYTTGYIDTIGKSSASVGRWEIDAKLPTFVGAWPALWLRCDTTAGEIDILEAVGGLPTRIVQTVHQDTSGSGDKSGFEWVQAGFDPSALHTYALERDADGSLRWYIDGALTRSRTPSDTDNQHQPMSWLGGATFASPLNLRINLQVGGSMPVYYGSDVTSSSVLPDDMVIAAVRFYA